MRCTGLKRAAPSLLRALREDWDQTWSIALAYTHCEAAQRPSGLRLHRMGAAKRPVIDKKPTVATKTFSGLPWCAGLVIAHLRLG